VLGMVVIGWIFIQLPKEVLVWVSLWMLLGIAWYIYITRFFRKSVALKLEE